MKMKDLQFWQKSEKYNGVTNAIIYLGNGVI